MFKEGEYITSNIPALRVGTKMTMQNADQYRLPMALVGMDHGHMLGKMVPFSPSTHSLSVIFSLTLEMKTLDIY